MTDDLMRDAKPLIGLPAQRATFMGIDPSLSATGIAVIRAGQIKSFVIAPPKTDNRGAARLAWFLEETEKLMRRYRPASVGIEGYAFGAKMKREALGELGGIIRLAVWRNLPHEAWEIPPTSVKAFATGTGNAAKDVVMREAYKRWGIDANDNNEVDAAVVAIMTMTRALDVRHLTKFQQQVLAKL